MLDFNRAYDQLGKEDVEVVRFAESLGVCVSREQVFAKILSAFQDQMVNEDASKQIAMFAGKVAIHLGFPKP